MRNFAENLIRYRIHVMLLLFVMTLAPFAGDMDAEKLRIALAFALWGGFVYLFNKTSDGAEDAHNKSGFPVPPAQFATLKAAAGLMFILGAVLLFGQRDLLLLYAVLSVLGLLYNGLGFFPAGWRLKKILFLKNIVPAAAWAAIPALVAPLYYGTPMGPYNALSFVFTFFLMMAVEIAWDVRDIKGDKKAGIATLPVSYGVNAARVFAALPLAALLAGLLLCRVDVPDHQMAATGATLALAGTIREDSGPYAYQMILFIWILALGFHVLRYSGVL